MCPSFGAAFYMHCGSMGQAECGGNLAAQAAANFKRVFEIGFIGKTTRVN
jgi:hypothetical protein